MTVENYLNDKIKNICVKSTTSLYKSKTNSYIYILKKSNENFNLYENEIIDLTKVRLSLKQFNEIYQKSHPEYRKQIILKYNFGLKYEQIFSYLIRIKDIENFKIFINNKLKPSFSYITSDLLDAEEKLLKKIHSIDKNGELLYEYILKNNNQSLVIKNYWDIYTKIHFPKVYDIIKPKESNETLISKENYETINIKINKIYLDNKYNLNYNISIQEYITKKNTMIFILTQILKDNQNLEINKIMHSEIGNYIELNIEKKYNQYDKSYFNNLISKIYDGFFYNINQEFNSTMVSIINKYVLYENLKENTKKGIKKI